MADFTELIGIIKRAALDAVNAEKPTSIMFGTVVSASPLKINVEQKMTLEAPQLILARNVTDYFIDITVAHKTELETEHTHNVWDSEDMEVYIGVAVPTQHLHEYMGRKRIRVHNALQIGEEVILIQVQGGQKFVVIDRLEGSPDVTSGEWLS